MRLRRGLVIGAIASVLATGACLVGLRLVLMPHSGRDSADADEALGWNDRYAILDATRAGSHSYVLVHVWTTVPDLMQRIDLYCYEDGRTTAERRDLRFSRQVVSENLDDNRQRRENGAYTARHPTKGAIDLRKKMITVEFDQGPPQLVPVPALEEQASGRACAGRPSG